VISPLARKIQNTIWTKVVIAVAMPPKANMDAIIAIIKEIIAHWSIRASFIQKMFTI
jgi:hypothetical protein